MKLIQFRQKHGSNIDRRSGGDRRSNVDSRKKKAIVHLIIAQREIASYPFFKEESKIILDLVTNLRERTVPISRAYSCERRKKAKAA